MNILFVCKANRFRSKVAEAYFNKINRNKKIKVKSAGIVKMNCINKKVNEVTKNLCFNIKGKPQKINEKIVNWADKIIIMGNNINITLPKDKKAIKWNIPDAEDSDLVGIKKSVILIKKKIDNLF